MSPFLPRKLSSMPLSLFHSEGVVGHGEWERLLGRDTLVGGVQARVGLEELAEKTILLFGGGGGFLMFSFQQARKGTSGPLLVLSS